MVLVSNVTSQTLYTTFLDMQCDDKENSKKMKDADSTKVQHNKYVCAALL